jgi:hypothetical protein
VVGVELWAKIRRMHRVERLSIREIGKRLGFIARRSGGGRRPRLRRRIQGRRPATVLDLKAHAAHGGGRTKHPSGGK